MTSEDLFQTAFEHASIGIALVAPDGRWLRMNQSMCDIVGYSAEELSLLTFQDITHPDDVEIDVSQAKRLMDGLIRSYRMEKRYFHKSGRIVWVVLSVSLARNVDGTARFFISQVTDITDRKQAEEDRDRIFALLETTLREKERLLSEVQTSALLVKTLQESLFSVCAWTKQVRCNGEWMSIEKFLQHYLQLSITHGMSDEAANVMLEEIKASVQLQPGAEGSSG